MTTRFDVFLSHNAQDKPVVERIALKLKENGLEPWFDKWHLTSGGNWQDDLAAGLRASSACAVFIGANGFGDWQREELAVAQSRAAKDRAFRLFLVLLPGLPDPFDYNSVPPFLLTRNWVDLRKGIEPDHPFQNFINAIKGVAPGPETPIEPHADICPYRGLQTFDEEHAEFFFGRDADIQRLIEKLKTTRFLAVVGPSGSGKSSLVRAGLIPALRKNALPDSAKWNIRFLTPGGYPLSFLAARLARLYSHDSMHKTLKQLGNDERTMHLAGTLALAERPATERLVWVIDQFEEVFTLCRDEHERGPFIANLLYAASVPDGQSVVILTLRADFYPRCAEYPELSALIAAQQFFVSPMGIHGLQQAIEEPARRVGLELEQGLVETILDDVCNQPGALPLLEHALLELWLRRRGRMLTLEGYRDSGGVKTAIAKRADAIYNSLSADQQSILRRIMLRLTQPGDGTEDTRRRATMKELVPRSDKSDAVESVVRVLTDARLLTTTADKSSDRWVDVSHEALIRSWPLLQQWVEENRTDLQIHRRISADAKEWLRWDRDVDILYTLPRLREVLIWRIRNEDALNDLERAFLNRSALPPILLILGSPCIGAIVSVVIAWQLLPSLGFWGVAVPILFMLFSSTAVSVLTTKQLGGKQVIIHLLQQSRYTCPPKQKKRH